MASIWTETATLPCFPALKGDLKTDVLIIGGGITGLLCARKLQDAGIDCAVAEADTICSCITKDTTAKITAQHGLIYHKLIKKFGTEKAGLYLKANLDALDAFRQLGDVERKNNFVYSLDDRKKLEKELSALEKLGYPAQIFDTVPLPLQTAGAVMFPDQAQFHPLKFLGGIVKDLKIYEHAPIRELKKFTAVSDHGTIRAEKIIIATHFPILNKHGFYYIKMYQHRSYCLGLANVPAVDGMFVDESQTGLSFRQQDDILILGGGSHRTGKHGGNWAELKTFAKANYPGAKIRYRWATQDCMTLDGVPYIGQYSSRTPGLYVATGFNKWGMTSAMTAATVLCDLICGRPDPYGGVFSPSRSILHPQLAVNSFEAVTNILRFTKKRCPHLGCALKWNPQERSWDCPCHGSRFDENGKLLNDPATGDLNS